MSGLRPTPLGWTVCTLALVGLGLGWLLGYRELAAIGITALVPLLAALVWVLPRPPVEVRREVEPAHVARGRAAQGLIVIENSGRVRLPALVATDRVAGKEIPVDLPPLTAGASKPVTYPISTQRRGHYLLGPLTVSRLDPLRLLRRDLLVGQPLQLWVQPRVYTIGLAATGLARDLQGAATDTAEGTITFQTLREYVIGDDLRRVHWRSSARTGQLMVRRDVDPSKPDLAILLDDRVEHYDSSDKAEEAVDFAASLTLSIRAAGFNARLLTESGLPLRGGGAGDGPTLLDGLAEHGSAAEAPTSLGEFDRALHNLGQGAAAVLVTGDPDAGRLEQLEGLRRKFTRVLALCLTEEPPVAVRGVTVLTGSGAETLARRWEQEAGR